MAASTMDKLKEEILKLIPPTVFFFISLHLIALVRKLMTAGTGLEPASTVQIAIAALILGKAVLLADMLPAINRFPAKPLIYNIVWKTTIYFVIAGVIHYLERLYDAWKVAGSIGTANAHLLKEIIWPHFWGIQIVVAVIIFNYCVVRELGRVIGEERFFRLFFRSGLASMPGAGAVER